MDNQPNDVQISVVIPCYRSENSIGQVVSRLEKVFSERNIDEYEIILVSDSSPDNVYGVIEELSKNNPKVIGIELARNFGQHSALMAGYRETRGEIVVSMDDDCQTPPESLFLLVDKLNEGYDVVYAQYNVVKQSGFRRWGSSVNKKMMEYLLNLPRDIVANSYFACSRFIIEDMIRYCNPYPYLAGLVLRATSSVAGVPVEQQERAEGNSGYTLKKLFSLWVNGFTAFSVKPLRIATVIGFISAGVGFFILFLTILNKFINPNVPLGYSSMISSILFIGGMIMLLLGILGEYIGRIYISLNNSPQYVIRRKTNRK